MMALRRLDARLFRAVRRFYPSSNTTICRSVWSTGTDPLPVSNALAPAEIQTVSDAVQQALGPQTRFVAVSLDESEKSKRCAEVIVQHPDGIATELSVSLDDDNNNNTNASILSTKNLHINQQPLLTPDDCDLAESIAKDSKEVQEALSERYGITDMNKVACDPWSVHLASVEDEEMAKGRRLVQTFLYQRVQGKDLEDNHYAHPIDILPVVDLLTKQVVRIDGLERTPPPKIPQASVNYHRDLLSTNEYLPTKYRENALKPLNIEQPEGPSFTVSDANLVQWQNWSFRVGFNYREGLVLHNVEFDNRSVVKRMSLVEMAVPYGDPREPYTRKCAFDVGDYGLGYCANSLELGCDCLGHIHYFDACLVDSTGQPKMVKKVICMHEEDDGLLWKHVEYRNGHNEARRSRELVVSFIATVVNYEYLFYVRFKLDGTIDYEIRLSGELSTNLPSQDEEDGLPTHGTLVAPGVNAQIHQHMFCVRLDMAVDGTNNSVSEVDIVPEPSPLGNAFVPHESVLKTELEAVRACDITRARSWKIFNPSVVNSVSRKPVAYKLIPFTRGPAMPTLLTDKNLSTVNNKGGFAEANLWVTPFDTKERFPAGEYVPQSTQPDGLPVWVRQNRSILNTNVVLWHAFGVTHMPRVEDFPVMPVETTGFTLKPDGFLEGNPAVDLPPDSNPKSKLSQGCCS